MLLSVAADFGLFPRGSGPIPGCERGAGSSSPLLLAAMSGSLFVALPDVVPSAGRWAQASILFFLCGSDGGQICPPERSEWAERLVTLGVHARTLREKCPEWLNLEVCWANTPGRMCLRLCLLPLTLSLRPCLS